MPEQPTVAITMGDPCGVGAEVIAKALALPELRALCRPLVVGDVTVLQRAFDLVGAPLRAVAVASPDDAVGAGAMAVLETPQGAGVAALPHGAIDPIAGRASAEWIHTAGQLALDDLVQAICTAPVNKAAMQLGGSPDLDHQSIFRRLTRSPKVMTMLLTTGLRVAHLTTHHSLRAACEHVTYDNILAALRLVHESFRTYGVPSARIGVAALNPHGGEEGLLGSEEAEAIAPAVLTAREEGIDATGPVPADSVFPQAISGKFDVVLAMYHDQGHIAIKVQGWVESVTMNLGLPFLRTSVDHGTAFDIAGKGIADATSMASAIRLAAQVAKEGRMPPVTP
jgi:4-phospho-D-threonate 3-dehydrogenase / 4-phospho-D-erythronate 3-dehydrogenase